MKPVFLDIRNRRYSENTDRHVIATSTRAIQEYQNTALPLLRALVSAQNTS